MDNALPVDPGAIGLTSRSYGAVGDVVSAHYLVHALRRIQRQTMPTAWESVSRPGLAIANFLVSGAHSCYFLSEGGLDRFLALAVS